MSAAEKLLTMAQAAERSECSVKTLPCCLEDLDTDC